MPGLVLYADLQQQGLSEGKKYLGLYLYGAIQR